MLPIALFNDAVVVKMLISNYQNENILVNIGSSVNIIFNSVFWIMSLVSSKLTFISKLFYGFRRVEGDKRNDYSYDDMERGREIIYCHEGLYHC